MVWPCRGSTLLPEFQAPFPRKEPVHHGFPMNTSALESRLYPRACGEWRMPKPVMNGLKKSDVAHDDAHVERSNLVEGLRGGEQRRLGVRPEDDGLGPALPAPRRRQGNNAVAVHSEHGYLQERPNSSTTDRWRVSSPTISAMRPPSKPNHTLFQKPVSARSSIGPIS